MAIGLIEIRDLDPNNFSERQANTFAILTNLSIEDFNRTKAFFRLANPGILGPGTLDTVIDALRTRGLDPTNAGVNAFKDARIPGGNQGPFRGKIGPQTAIFYLHALINVGDFTFETSYTASELKSHFNEIRFRGYEAIIGDAAQEFEIQPSIIAGVGSRESFWGLILSPPGPAGVGDSGHGRGLMQIDDGAHEFARTGPWRDPRKNVFFGCQLLAGNRESLRREGLSGRFLLKATLASYNAGLGGVQRALRDGDDPDSRTTGRDYGKDVMDRAGWFQKFADFE